MSRSIRRTALALCLALTATTPFAAQARDDAPTNPAGLAPGAYDWHPELAPSGPVLIVVSIDDQLAYVYRSGTLIGTTTVSTGRPGHETPTGVFSILERQKIHHSNLYESPNGGDAPMPYMLRLTWDGVALHAGRVPGHPASHGCVRLPPEFAKKLFDATYRGTTVVVTDAASPYTIDLAGVPADMAELVFARPWRKVLPAVGDEPVPVTGGGGGPARAD
jgi:hypothetical protein